jgi:hypothetical protein
LHILSKYFFLIFPEGRILNDINTHIMWFYHLFYLSIFRSLH